MAEIDQIEFHNWFCTLSAFTSSYAIDVANIYRVQRNIAVLEQKPANESLIGHGDLI